MPAKLGDAYRSYLLKRNSGVSFSSTIGTILAERVIDLLVLFGLLAASFTLVGQRLSSNSKNGDFDLGLVMLVGALMVIALIVGLVGLRFFGDLLLRFVPGKYKEKFTSFQQGHPALVQAAQLACAVGLYHIDLAVRGGEALFCYTVARCARGDDLGCDLYRSA